MSEADEVPRLVQRVSEELRALLTTLLLDIDQLQDLEPAELAPRSLATLRQVARRLDAAADQVHGLVDGTRPEPTSVSQLGRQERPRPSPDGSIHGNVLSSQLVLQAAGHVGLPVPSTVEASDGEVILTFDTLTALVSWADWAEVTIESRTDEANPDRTIHRATTVVFDVVFHLEHSTSRA